MGEDKAGRQVRGTTAAWVALVGLCLAGLTAAFVFSLRQSQFYFDRAALAQEQMVAVAQIETYVNRAGRAPAEVLAAYVASTSAEQALLAGHEEATQFDPAEVTDAKRLAAIAAVDASALSAEGRAALQDEAHRLVAAISERERAEASKTAADMAALRARMSMLGVGVALIALVTAIAGAWMLWTANWRLANLVASRTTLLEERNARLAAIDRSRRLFFAKVSHELRTPVTVMRGEAEVTLADAKADVPALRDALFHVAASAEFLERRLVDLLGIARADDGRLQLSFEPVDLGEMLREIGGEAERFARSSAVKIAIDAPAAPVIVSGDRLWLGRAVMSMIDNGVKFSPQGGVLNLRLTQAGDSAVIEVADSGAGAPPAELPRLFDAFYQADEGRARGGSGLGLALTRWLAEQHKGSVRAVNAPGGGCVFAMTLPVTA